jgi:1-acyl-sn-glycerol-3-phosphate acyltransferase
MFRRVLGWVLMPFFAFAFFLVLCIFHVVQVVARALGGYHAHKKSVDALLFSLLQVLKLTGASVRLAPLPAGLDQGRPLLLVSNHQSMYDIVLVGWLFRRFHPKYVSKIELAKGIPSISYNLRHGGSVCIDRKDIRQSLPALKAFGQYLAEHKYAGCIFPEGTRARDGKLKPFKPQGLALLLKTMPDALVVPVAIEGSWEIMKYGLRPVPFGCRLRCTALAPVERADKTSDQLVAECEANIRAFLGQKLEKTTEDA